MLKRMSQIFIIFFLISCNKGSGNFAPIKEILCADPQSRGGLTVGLNLETLKLLSAILGTDKDQNINSASVLSDDLVLKTLNQALITSGVKPEILNILSVSSVVPGDTVRFLKIGGDYAPGFGVAARLFKAIASQSPQMQNLFQFIHESVRVSMADAIFSSQQKAVSPKQWALKQTDFAQAQTIVGRPSREVIVAVIDTGVDLSHPDLKNVLVPGYNFVDNNETPQDGNGHGTHCAGIIAAQGLSGPDAPFGVASGVNVKIMPIKVLSDNGSGSTQNIEKGIRWAVAHNADVISMSLGGGLEYSDAKSAGGLNNEIVNDAIAKGTVVVVAAGNEKCPLGGKCTEPNGFFSSKFEEYTVLPCSYEGTICVGATDYDENLAAYSNYSSQKTNTNYRTHADVNAPGTNIWSTWPTKLNGPYKAISGTSMATPYVAGVAAILKAQSTATEPVSQQIVLQYLRKGAVQWAPAVQKSEAGRVDLYRTAAYFGREYLKRTDIPEPGISAPKPLPQPEIPGDNGKSLPLNSLWDFLCAVP